MNKKIFFLVFSLLLFKIFLLDVKSEILSLNCKKINDFDKTLNDSLFKEINLEEKIIKSQIGVLYDEILHINKSEIIFKNNVYESYSVYNTFINELTYYFPRKIVKFNCNKALD